MFYCISNILKTRNFKFFHNLPIQNVPKDQLKMMLQFTSKIFVCLWIEFKFFAANHLPNISNGMQKGCK